MDLSNLDVKAGSNLGSTLHLLHPVDDTPLMTTPPKKSEKSKPITITVLGTDSDSYRDLLKARARKRLAAQKGNNQNKPVDLDETERRGIELLASCTIGWENIMEKGLLVPFSKSNVIQIYTRYPWIKEQVDVYMADRSNFLGG